jgi:hypothetical protein
MKVKILLLMLLVSQCRGTEQFRYEPWSNQFESDYDSLFDIDFVKDDSLTAKLSLFLNKEVFSSKVVKVLQQGDKSVELIMTTMEVGVPVFLVLRNKKNEIIEAQEVVEEYEEYLKAFYSVNGLYYCKEIDFERFDIPGELDSIVIRSYNRLNIKIDEINTINFDTIKLEFPKVIKLHEDRRIRFPNLD